MPSESTGHPLELGARLSCERSNGQPHLCEIIERRSSAAGWEYYVHYVDCDRRLDEWVSAERMQLDSTDDPSASDKAASHGSDREFGHRRATRKMKRKIDEMNHVQGGAEHDEALEKEHEESTKLKNIQRIEMGRWARARGGLKAGGGGQLAAHRSRCAAARRCPPPAAGPAASPPSHPLRPYPSPPSSLSASLAPTPDPSTGLRSTLGTFLRTPTTLLGSRSCTSASSRSST